MTEEQIIRLYGKRCAEYCDDCCVCEVWAMYDLIETQAREIERLREALRALLLYAAPNTLGSLPAFTRAHAALKGDSHDQ